MKINFLPWHQEVISLWEKIVNENKIIQVTLFAYKSQGKLSTISFDEKSQKIYPYKMDEKFFGIFSSENSDERSVENVTIILEDQILYFCKKIIEDIEMENEIILEDNVFALGYEPLTEGAYIRPNERRKVKIDNFTEKIILEIRNIINLFGKNMIAA